MPVAESIRAMMSQSDAEDFPLIPRGHRTGPGTCTCTFRSTATGRRTTSCTYTGRRPLEAFSEQAQAAQFQQYKAMFEAVRAHVERVHRCILWRSAPGWTVLRG